MAGRGDPYSAVAARLPASPKRQAFATATPRAGIAGRGRLSSENGAKRLKADRSIRGTGSPLTGTAVPICPAHEPNRVIGKGGTRPWEPIRTLLPKAERPEHRPISTT